MEREAIIGIDGGGTGSRGIVADPGGDLLAEAEGGPLNPYVLPPEAVDRNLRDLIDRLLSGAGLTADRVRGVGAGLSGVRWCYPEG